MRSCEEDIEILHVVTACSGKWQQAKPNQVISFRTFKVTKKLKGNLCLIKVVNQCNNFRSLSQIAWSNPGIVATPASESPGIANPGL